MAILPLGVVFKLTLKGFPVPLITAFILIFREANKLRVGLPGAGFILRAVRRLISPFPPAGPGLVRISTEVPKLNGTVILLSKTVAGLVTPSGVNIPPAKAPPIGTEPPETILTSVGSRSHKPGLPKDELALMLIPKTSKLILPEVSINPPSPPRLPPLALMVPKKRVVRSAHTITLPPEALPNPLALIRVFVFAKVN